MSGDEELEATHEEGCDQALAQYEKSSTESMYYSSLVPMAIKYFKEHYVRRGKRKIIYTPGTLLDALNEGWTFDPWLNPSGRPIHISDIDYKGTVPSVDPKPTLSVYWILVKGSPEQIAEMDPIAELPELEGEEIVLEPGMAPYGLRTDFIPYDVKGEPSREPQPGYVVMDKGHIYAKGTVYTLPAKPISSWGLAIQLADLSTVLGVDEAHDVIAGILKKERAEISG